MSAEWHVKCIWQRIFWWETSPSPAPPPLLCHSLWKERHKNPLGWILQDQLNVALEERLSYGRPMCGETAPLMTKTRQKNETWTGRRNSPGSFSVFISWPPLHILIPGGQVCFLWKQAKGHTYPGCTWFLLSFVLGFLEQEKIISKSIAKMASHQ